MEATFTITPDPAANLLRISMGGFFALPDIARFTAALADGLAPLKTGPNRHRTLVDIRRMDIQAGEAVAEFQRLLANPHTASSLIAFVTAKSLTSMQLRRAATGRVARYFETVEDAETWLLSTGADTAPRRSVG